MLLCLSRFLFTTVVCSFHSISVTLHHRKVTQGYIIHIVGMGVPPMCALFPFLQQQNLLTTTMRIHSSVHDKFQMHYDLVHHILYIVVLRWPYIACSCWKETSVHKRRQ